MKNEKRYKIAYISHEFLVDLFTIGNKIHQKAIKGMPETARIQSVFYEPLRGCFGVVIYDESFEIIKEAEVLPILEMEFQLLGDNK